MMRSWITVTAMMLALAACARADEPILRVQVIQPARQTLSPQLFRKRRSDHSYYRVSVNTSGYGGDFYRTDHNSLAALVFFGGGQLGLNRDTEIEVTSAARSATDDRSPVRQVVLQSGGLWIEAYSLRQAIELKTHGGVICVLSAEVVLEACNNGNVRCSCLRSDNQLGGVEVRDGRGNLLGRAQAGDQYDLPPAGEARVKHHDDVASFRNQALQAFQQLFAFPPADR